LRVKVNDFSLAEGCWCAVARDMKRVYGQTTSKSLILYDLNQTEKMQLPKLLSELQ